MGLANVQKLSIADLEEDFEEPHLQSGYDRESDGSEFEQRKPQARPEEESDGSDFGGSASHGAESHFIGQSGAESVSDEKTLTTLTAALMLLRRLLSCSSDV